ncbi:acetyl-CoA carboxylase biotin carboxyl carrier protein [Nonomuraea sp. NPDC050451]|uniref:acetyl-CoA carboxylase biotin carboxyl carrier protein n=1 Tax=Nonomuraea sp. NPDC050451 TaxID=3364364 RepID=UPI00379BB964
MSGEQRERPTLGELSCELTSLVRSLPGPLASVSLRTGDYEVELTWARTEAPDQPREPDQAPGEPGFEAGFEAAVAPVVGTFYVAPEPGAEPYVKPGDRVEEGQTLGVVEAMKLMNPIAAPRPGEVVEVLVENGTPVEFGQQLVLLRTELP